jgi:hypothetical protein
MNTPPKQSLDGAPSRFEALRKAGHPPGFKGFQERDFVTTTTSS